MLQGSVYIMGLLEEKILERIKSNLPSENLRPRDVLVDLCRGKVKVPGRLHLTLYISEMI